MRSGFVYREIPLSSSLQFVLHLGMMLTRKESQSPFHWREVGGWRESGLNSEWEDVHVRVTDSSGVQLRNKKEKEKEGGFILKEKKFM